MSVRYEMRSIGVFDRDTGRVIRSQDHEWQEYDAWNRNGGIPDPMPEPVHPAPAIPPFDFAAEGANRRERALQRLAKTNPTEALLRKAGLK